MATQTHCPCMGAIIRDCRVDLGLTQAELAVELGVTRQCIYYWESETAHPSEHYQEILAEFFDVPRRLLFPAGRAFPEDEPHPSVEGLRDRDGFRVSRVTRADGSTFMVRVPMKPVPMDVGWITEDEPRARAATSHLLADVLAG